MSPVWSEVELVLNRWQLKAYEIDSRRFAAWSAFFAELSVELFEKTGIDAYWPPVAHRSRVGVDSVAAMCSRTLALTRSRNASGTWLVLVTIPARIISLRSVADSFSSSSAVQSFRSVMSAKVVVQALVHPVRRRFGPR